MSWPQNLNVHEFDEQSSGVSLPVRLFVSIYPEQSAQRRLELQACLEKNQESQLFDNVCLLVEGAAELTVSTNRVERRRFSERPTYRDYFQWANECLSSDDDYSVIANSDLYFDDTLLPLVRCLKLGQCAALSRWDVQADGSARLFDRNDSQDVWIFKGKIRPVVSDYLMGVPRCDNRLLYELRRAGYEVINPSFSVRAFHRHAGERMEYPGQIEGPYVEGPYEYLWPHNLMSLPQTFLHNRQNPDSKLGWRIDWRRLQRTLPWRVFNKIKRRWGWGEERGAKS